jgi:hypothetical protein
MSLKGLECPESKLANSDATRARALRHLELLPRERPQADPALPALRVRLHDFQRDVDLKTI